MVDIPKILSQLDHRARYADYRGEGRDHEYWKHGASLFNETELQQITSRMLSMAEGLEADREKYWREFEENLPADLKAMITEYSQLLDACAKAQGFVDPKHSAFLKREFRYCLIQLGEENAREDFEALIAEARMVLSAMEEYPGLGWSQALQKKILKSLTSDEQPQICP